MNKHYFYRRCILSCLIVYTGTADAASITWVAQNPNNDMNNSSNWNPNTVPGNSDDAIFNSNISGVNINPTENSAPFSVSTFNFPSKSSIFNFSFTNQTLTLSGAGITGTNSAPRITVTNTNNTSFPGDLVSFTGVTATSGSSIITTTNSGTLTGNQSSTAIGSINSNLHSTEAFTVANGGDLTASNTGNDSTNGTGNNGTANTGSGQMVFDHSFTAGNNVTVSISNSGTFSGTNTVQGDAVAIVNGSQLITSGAFVVGDNFNCEIENAGNNSSLGVGLSNIGQLNTAQMILQTTGSVGNNCKLSVSNTGTNSSQATSFPDFIGYLNDQQFYVADNFQAGDDFSLTVSNTGTDTSNGFGNHQVAVINSNSGTTGNQILFQHGCILGDRATINASNDGTYSGTNTNGGSNVAGMNLQQIVIGKDTAPGSYSFVAGDYLNLSTSSSGIDSSSGTGGDSVGNVSTDQISIFAPTTIGNHANITITKSGNFSGNASATYVNVGSSGGCQLNCVSSVSIGDNLSLNVSNIGTNTSSGIGSSFIGDIITGQQVTFQDSLSIGNNAFIKITNYGSNSSNTTNNNQVGSFMGYGKQLFANDSFHIGDDFILEITNTGFDDSTGAGGNLVGFLNNNTIDNSGSQVHLSGGGNIGERASITLSNVGTYQGNNTVSGNVIAVLAGQQLHSADNFHVGNDFALTVSNSGIDKASGANGNSIATISNSQVEFDSDCVTGNNASIVISNSGTNNDTTGLSNNIGVINGTQMLVHGDFSAGTSASIQVNNTTTNNGNPNNFVGQIIGSQLDFGQGCTLSDGTVIRAFNSGVVNVSQIIFNQGFNIVGGSVTIQAINQGTVGAFGIDIQGSNAGGNANVVLSNSSLNIGTTLPTFTIAGLDGDSASVVQSQPQLIIQTNATTKTEFSGIIQNYPATSSTLMKTGAGTQKLSGINTYTGLTTVQEGTLVINGSIAGDLLTDSIGLLKGNGAIAGTFTNAGTVSPGESIGTLTVGNFINNNGIYAVEVNGLGQSDLIDASGTAIINGGTVIVSSSDGTFRFQQPYTILTAAGGVVGAFTEVTSEAFIISKLIYGPDGIIMTTQSDLSRAAEKCNQIGVATNLDNLINPDATQSLLIGAIANLPLADAQESLESLSGFQYTNENLVTNISTSRLLRRLYDPLRPLVNSCNQCSCCDEWTSWLETGYGFTNLNRDNAHKLDFNSYQLTGGIQRTFCCALTFGLAGSYENDNIRYRDGKANRNSGFVSAYGLYRPSIFYGLFDLVYGNSTTRLKRVIDAGNLHYTAHSKPDVNLFTFYGEAGFDLNCDCVLIQPFLGIQIGKTWRGRINESQANGWGLTIDKNNWSTTSSRLGLHLSTSNLCNCIDTCLDVAWNQLWSSRKNSSVGRFKEFGNSFSICGNQQDNYSFDCALTFTTCLCEGMKGYFELDGEWWQHANTFNIIGGIEYCW